MLDCKARPFPMGKEEPLDGSKGLRITGPREEISSAEIGIHFWGGPFLSINRSPSGSYLSLSPHHMPPIPPSIVTNTLFTIGP